MSVAFRRESDEEHLEPKFERPIPPGPNLVTARGLALMNARVAECEAAIAAGGTEEALAEARRDLRYWSTRVVTAIPAPIPDGEEVAFGTRVTFRLHGAERTIGIVGADEADPAADLVGVSAPLVRALLGAMASERLDFGGSAGALEVVAIEVMREP